MHRALVSLAIVTALWEKRRSDYLDNFVPFVATHVARKGLTQIANDSVNHFCEEFREDFGLSIPYHPMIALLNRCRRRGILKRIGTGYTFDRTIVDRMDFSSEELRYNANVREVVRDFIQFASDSFKQTVSEEVAEELLLDLLRKSDMDILFACRDTSSALPPVKLAARHRRFNHILGRYIIHTHEHNPRLFRQLADISIGHVITNAILVYDHDWSGETLRGAHLYFDTPILLKLLGADGPEQEQAYSDFLGRLSAAGAKLLVFEHTYAELNEILESSKIWVNNPRYDPSKANRVTLYFRQAGYSELDIEKFILRVDVVFQRHKIEVVPVPPFMELRLHQIDERSLQAVVEQVSTERDPHFDKDRFETRVRRDIASISAIYRLRGESRPRFIRHARHLLITNNVAIILANKRYMTENWRYEYELPACVTDVFVGTVLWMNSPPEAALECRGRLVASCYAAVRPDPELETRLIQEARQLQAANRITPDDFTLLSSSLVIRDLLADATLNDKDAFTTKTALEILEEIKSRIKSDAVGPFLQKQKELEAEVASSRMERDRALADLDRFIEKRARTWARLENAVIGAALGLGVIVPLCLSFLVTWYFLFASGALGLFGVYLGFSRSFTFPAHFKSAIQRHADRIRKKLHDASSHKKGAMTSR